MRLSCIGCPAANLGGGTSVEQFKLHNCQVRFDSPVSEGVFLDPSGGFLVVFWGPPGGLPQSSSWCVWQAQVGMGREILGKGAKGS